MGFVWHAEDTKLHRDVALKFLPSDVVSNPERLSRFEREARMLASLNDAKARSRCWTSAWPRRWTKSLQLQTPDLK